MTTLKFTAKHQIWGNIIGFWRGPTGRAMNCGGVDLVIEMGKDHPFDLTTLHYTSCQDWRFTDLEDLPVDAPWDRESWDLKASWEIQYPEPKRDRGLSIRLVIMFFGCDDDPVILHSTPEEKTRSLSDLNNDLCQRHTYRSGIYIFEGEQWYEQYEYDYESYCEGTLRRPTNIELACIARGGNPFRPDAIEATKLALKSERTADDGSMQLAGADDPSLSADSSPRRRRGRHSFETFEDYFANDDLFYPGDGP